MDTVHDYIESLLASRLADQVTHHRILPGREAVYGKPVRPWPAAIDRLLASRGIPALYSHQARATDLLRAGRNLVTATPTASGKTLIYSLPLLERFLIDPDARALLLFPLKALAQDQLAAFERLVEPWPKDARPTLALYDGDTSAHFRKKIRLKPPNILITNPEMLHLSLLPHHEQWTTFLATLSLVVTDEAHTYRGVPGSHMAQLFRRLQRICSRYNAHPTHSFCTATVGNPAELATNLLGGSSQANTEELAVISESGAPSGPRHFVFLNPENSPSSLAIQLLRAALARGLRTIVYCRSRRMTELLALWVSEKAGQDKNRISAYRAGFLPEERRDIEARMGSGELLAVISTSALELGIDIGNLDLCILVGYPGTVMATLQRGGRVGRSGQESAVLLIAGEDALDQYFIHQPEAFFERGAEQAVVNPNNEVILKRHLECAAAETPLRITEPWTRTPEAVRMIAELEQEGLLLRSADGNEWLAARKRPQRHVDLRGAGSSFAIVDADGNNIGTVDGHQAYRETHPGAIYLHRGRTYEIKSLDPAERIIRAEIPAAKVNWFTRARSAKVTEILSVIQTGTAFSSSIGFGKLRVTETITGYEKRAVSGNRLLNIVPLDVPPFLFETEGIWFRISDAARHAVEDGLMHFMGAIHALEHACIGLLPLVVMADRNDFGGISTPMHPQLGTPGVFIYDGLPGGAGLARAAFPRLEELFTATRDLLRRCPCETGCPSCVHSPKCGSGNRPVDKAAALFLIEQILTASASAPECWPDISLPSSEHGMAVQPEHPQPPLPSPAPATPATGAFPQIATPSVVRPLPRRFMVLDVETRRSAAEVGGWNRADRMGVSIAVLYDAGEDAFIHYTQDQLDAMFERLRLSDLVIGFNSIRFDYQVLQPFANYELRSLPSLDLLVEIKNRLSYRLSLDTIAKATLGTPKSADGLQALRWWKEGNLRDIATYCQKDVEITRDVYLFGRNNGYLLFTNKAGQAVRIPVSW